MNQLSKMELYPPIGCANLKWKPMQHSTNTAKCISKEVSHPSTCGIWIMDLLVIEFYFIFNNILYLMTVFLGVILIKRAGDGARNIKGCWDSIHVIEVQEKSTGRSAHYKLTSTVMLWLQTNRPGSGTMNLGGSLTRQVPSSKLRLN